MTSNRNSREAAKKRFAVALCELARKDHVPANVNACIAMMKAMFRGAERLRQDERTSHPSDWQERLHKRADIDRIDEFDVSIEHERTGRTVIFANGTFALCFRFIPASKKEQFVVAPDHIVSTVATPAELLVGDSVLSLDDYRLENIRLMQSSRGLKSILDTLLRRKVRRIFP